MENLDQGRCPSWHAGCTSRVRPDAPAPPIDEVVLMARVDALLPPDDGAPGPVALLAELTDDELRRAWGSTCGRLGRLGPATGWGSARAGLALERAWYLDEMERRAPEGFSCCPLPSFSGGSGRAD